MNVKKAIVLSGASGNLGKAILEKLSREYLIYALTRPHSGGQDFENEQIRACEVDMFDENSVKHLMQLLADMPTQIEAGILTVGGFESGNLLHTSMDEIKKMFHLNFESAFAIAKNLFQYFENRGGGQIILIGAKAGIEAQETKNNLAYGFSKSLLFRLAEVINEEGKGKNITATVIVPSTIDTPATRKSAPEADYTQWVKPENIADLLSFMLSESGKMRRESVIKFYHNA